MTTRTRWAFCLLTDLIADQRNRGAAGGVLSIVTTQALRSGFPARRNRLIAPTPAWVAVTVGRP